MIGLALLVSASVAGASPFHGPLVEQQHSLGGLSGFAVRAHVHVDGPGAPPGPELTQQAEAQMSEALRSKGIPVVDAPDRPGPFTAAIGYLILDIHVRDAGGGTAVAWSLQGARLALLGTGELALSTTWEAGDLVFGGSSTAAALVRDSLKSGLDDFCQAVLSRRPAEPTPNRAREVTGAEL